MSHSALVGKTVVLGVSGGIAAYKAAELVRLLRKAGAQVHVIMTAAAQRFLTPLTLQALSGHPVATDLFDLGQESQIGHIELADRADLLVVAPATADLIARLALGLADDVLTAVALACRRPLLLAPAMNVHMWHHPQVQEHLRRLVQRGVHTCGPDAGELACGWIGPGRMVDPQVVVEAAAAILEGSVRAQDLHGVHLLVSAGPTHEPLDAVRFIGNRSSGKMGFALAAAAAQRGAQVTLVAGPVSLPTPAGVRRIDVETAAQMAEAILGALTPAGGEPAPDAPDAPDAIVMAAAVADYTPAGPAGGKLKKEALGPCPTLQLVPTVDILAELGRRRRGRRPVLVGFAAETERLEEHAADKLVRKGCDLIVANDISEPGSGFGTDTNRVTLVGWGPDGAPSWTRLPQLSKREVAHRVLDRVAALLSS
ncbi:MAG: bifunctional phosphopantothenoylcysteine decarboxylase/phosphopantothenate--cysteine ligase CoaBC [Myxococcales bacterium]|nr:bifunctional phosphopantothenoylcysteine decarboxylase/phosphopantothenate--cysteine ligase CoaBC [Myxococcota bacterium]MDW8282731.1 bifunctional phosphopantothenoylcysteine decarboxylase/phosphopantothenate--cysteine ligase CoaBC [Myxococcales bacterium]